MDRASRWHPSPEWTKGVPICTEDRCPEYDGKRCKMMGFRPCRICEPVVQQLSGVNGVKCPGEVVGIEDCWTGYSQHGGSSYGYEYNVLLDGDKHPRLVDPDNMKRSRSRKRNV